MPVKWKIFLALNFILSLPAFICFILLTINIFSTYRTNGADTADIYIPILFLLGLILISFNGFLNVYVLQRFYPDKIISPTVKTLNVLSLIFNILVAIGILILCIYAAGIEFETRNNYRGESSNGKIALLLIFIALIIDIIILVMQGMLPGIINRNSYRKIDSLIDSIGE